MVRDGEGEMLHAEISECQRLQGLYEMRLQCLMDRNPRLPLVRQGRTDLYEHYQDHFCEKIRVNALAVEAAREVLEKWKAPPQRPRRVSPPNDDFMADFENEVLQSWDARLGIPRGTRRFENTEWAALIKRNVYPHHSDVDWSEYTAWVSQGKGDEWFQEDNKWQTGQQDSKRSTKNWGALVRKLLDSQ
jgi:hypothetical protein